MKTELDPNTIKGQDPETAIALTQGFIYETFKDITDKSGRPFYLHCFDVMHLLPYDACLDLKLAALLHDVLEDTNYTKEALLNRGYSEYCVHLVWWVTKTPQTFAGTYMDWIRYICEKAPYDAVLLKYADNKHNSLPSRVVTLPDNEKDILKRYQRAAVLLEARLRRGR